MSQENDIEQSMTAGDVGGVLADQSDVLLDTDGGEHLRETHDEQWQERESRNALKHVAGLGEIQDVTEVEYRKVRLERVVLVGVWSSRETTQAAAEESLRELAALAETAGAVVCDGLLQHRIKPDAATYVGSGKARELAGIVAQDEADTIVVDDDLPPSQRRALEDATKVKVVDRTAVILDIFAQHATSREGKAQVGAWHSSNTCCRDCAAGAGRCRVRRVAARQATRASARVVRVRRKSKWTVA